MKHRVKGRKFSRVKKQRKALLKSLLGSFFMREKITTTEAKAKEIKPLVDKIINKSKQTKKDEKRKIAIVRELGKTLPQIAVKKISGDFINRFDQRTGGYTRITKIERRKSDGAKMAVIEFV